MLSAEPFSGTHTRQKQSTVSVGSWFVVMQIFNYWNESISKPRSRDLRKLSDIFFYMPNELDNGSFFIAVRHRQAKSYSQL